MMNMTPADQWLLPWPPTEYRAQFLGESYRNLDEIRYLFQLTHPLPLHAVPVK